MKYSYYSFLWFKHFFHIIFHNHFSYHLYPTSLLSCDLCSIITWLEVHLWYALLNISAGHWQTKGWPSYVSHHVLLVTSSLSVYSLKSFFYINLNYTYIFELCCELTDFTEFLLSIKSPQLNMTSWDGTVSLCAWF